MFDTSPTKQAEIVELVGEIYQAALTGQWADVLHQINALTDSNKAFFFLNQLDHHAPIIVELATNLDYPEQALIDYQSRPLDDPYYAITKGMSEGDTLNLNDLMDIERHKDTDFYRHILKPMDSGKVLSACLIRDGHYEAMFAINRGFNDAAYTQRDLALLNSLTPHLSRAMHIYKELRLYKQYTSISKSILDQQDKAIVVCDADSVILTSNRFAQAHLSQSEAIFVADHVLSTHSPLMTKRLHQYIRQCAALRYLEVGVQESLVIEQDNQTEAVIAISPLHSQADLVDYEVPCALVTVTFQNTFNWQRVEEEYGMTPTELALLKDLHSKKSLKRIATDSGRAYNTLRVHMQHIYRKFGVSSQIELMVKLSAFRG